MHYLLLIRANPANYERLDASQLAALLQGHEALIDEAKAAGTFIASQPLAADPASARVVRKVDGRDLVTDGPYAETKEVLGGYYLIDVASLEEAVRFAGRIPDAALGTIEVRQVLDLPRS